SRDHFSGDRTVQQESLRALPRFPEPLHRRDLVRSSYCVDDSVVHPHGGTAAHSGPLPGLDRVPHRDHSLHGPRLPGSEIQIAGHWRHGRETSRRCLASHFFQAGALPAPAPLDRTPPESPLYLLLVPDLLNCSQGGVVTGRTVTCEFGFFITISASMEPLPLPCFRDFIANVFVTMWTSSIQVFSTAPGLCSTRPISMETRTLLLISSIPILQESRGGSITTKAPSSLRPTPLTLSRTRAIASFMIPTSSRAPASSR